MKTNKRGKKKNFRWLHAIHRHTNALALLILCIPLYYSIIL